MAKFVTPLSVRYDDSQTPNANANYIDSKRNALKTLSYNSQTLFRENFANKSAAYYANLWNVTLGEGDQLLLEGNVGGTTYLTITKSPFNAGTISRLALKQGADLPFNLKWAFGMSQRTNLQRLTYQVLPTDPSYKTATAPTPIPIATIAQTASVLTITFNSPHGLLPGEKFCVYGVTGDERANYPYLTVASTPNPLTLTATAGSLGTIPSTTITTQNMGNIIKVDPLNGYSSGYAVSYENTTATQGALYTKSNGSSTTPTGTLLGNHHITTGSTAVTLLANTTGTESFSPSVDSKVNCKNDRLQYTDLALDSSSTSWSIRATNSRIIPNFTLSYSPCFEFENAPALTGPVAKIVTAAKTGTTTATITTETAHGLVTGDLVLIYGVSDQTNFPNITTATAVTVVDATSFTIVQGGAVTATARGGHVSLVYGQQTAYGQITQAIVNVVRSSNVLILTGSASWTGLSIGQVVDIYGVRDGTTGADIGIDGSYKVYDIATTTLTLAPFGGLRKNDIDTGNLAGGLISPVGADIGSVATGGSVILRTAAYTFRVGVSDLEEVLVDSASEGVLDSAKSIPANITSGTVTTVSTVTTSGTPTVPATPYFVNSAASTNGALILTGTSGLHAFYASNIGASVAYVKLYNKATAPTVGTDVPEMVIPVPAAVGSVAGVVELTPGYNAYRFALGLGIAITGLMADSDTTAVAAGQVKVKLSRTV